MSLDNDVIENGVPILATRIPQGRKVEGLRYGAFVSRMASGWVGYYVRVGESWAVVRQTPAADELAKPEDGESQDEAIVREIKAELDERD